MENCSRCKKLELYLKRLCSYIDALEDGVIELGDIQKLKIMDEVKSATLMLKEIGIE